MPEVESKGFEKSEGFEVSIGKETGKFDINLKEDKSVEISVSEITETIYLQIREGEVSKTKEIKFMNLKDIINFDLDSSGKLLGIEIIKGD